MAYHRVVVLILVALTLCGCERQPGDLQQAYLRAQRAQDLEDDGNLQAAIAEMSEVVRLDPDEADYRVKLGYLLLADDRADEGVEQFQRARELNPEKLPALEGLCWAYLRLKEPARAQEAVEIYLGLYPDNENMREQLAKLLAENEPTWDQAANEYRRLLERHPDEPRYLAALGALLWKQDRRSEAIDMYLAAIKADPDWEEGHLLLSKALAESGRSHDALLNVMGALRSQPGHERLRALLGDLYARDPATLPYAPEEYRQALEHDPDNFELRMKLGEVLMALNRYEEAADQLSLALEQAPDRVDLHFRRFEMYRQLDQPGKAVDSLRQLVERAPDNFDAVVNLGFGLMDLGQPREAAAEFRRALALEPDSLPALEGMAWSLFELHDPEAVAVATEFLRRQPEQWPLRERLADVLAALPDKQHAAVEHYQYILTNTTDAPLRIRGKLAKTLIALDRTEAGLAQLKILLDDDPGQEEYFFLRINTLTRLDRAQEAATELQAFLADHPSHLGARETLAFLLLEQGLHQRATGEFRHILSLEPLRAASLEGLAWALLKSGSAALAVPTIRQLLRLEPGKTALHRALFETLAADPASTVEAHREGLRLLEETPDDLDLTGRWLDFLWTASMTTDFQRDAPAYLKSRPGDWGVRSRLAELRQQQGDLPGAIELYRQAPNDSAETPRALTTVGFLHLQQQDFEAAIAAFRQAIERNPGAVHLAAMEGLAWAYVKKGDAEAARQTLERLVPLLPGRADLLEQLADLWADAQDTAIQAADAYLKLYREHSRDERLLRKRLLALAAARRLHQAANEGEALLRGHDEDPALERLVLSLLLEAGETERARALYRTIIDERPDDLDARRGFAYHLYDNKRFTEAEAAFGELVRYLPDDPAVQEALLWCRLSLDRKADALVPLRRLLDAQPARKDLHELYADLLVGDPTTARQGRLEYERLLAGKPYDRALDSTRTD